MVNAKSILLNGIVKENPVLVLALGTCATIAVTTQAVNGLGMGLATMAVLVCSNVAVAALKNLIPDEVHIPCYIVIIAGFVTIVGFLLEAFAPGLYDALGVFLALIVVNCLILGRAEMFAAKRSVGEALLDGVGMGLGFTLALTAIGVIRELLGSGTVFGWQLLPQAVSPMSVFLLGPGGFFVFGCMIALVNRINVKRGLPLRNACASCPKVGFCGNAGEAGREVESCPK